VLGLARRSNRNEEATTIPKQIEKINGACDREGYDLVAIPEDGGVSGKYSLFDLGKRKALAPWLTDTALISQWDILMYVDDDRLLRSVEYNDQLHKWCEKHGKTIMKTDGRVVSMKKAGEWLVVTIQAAVNEFYWRQLAEKRADTARFLKQQGKLNGGGRSVPYGFTRGRDGKPAVVPHEAKVIRRIVHMILGGMTLIAICERLTVEGVPTRRGGTWAASAVSRIINRLAEPYARAADGSPYCYPEIIPPGDLARAREILASRSFKVSPKNCSARHDGTQLLRVAFCRDGHPFHSFRNGRHRYYRDNFCSGPQIRMDLPDRLRLIPPRFPVLQALPCR
jgi:DNA invertase Pin-like site-specific DNA recombinase